MGESNGDWGRLAAADDELAEVWDSYEPLPEPGQNAALDAFVARKNIDINALVRLGARMSEPPNVIAFAFGAGIKFRDVVTDHRWSYAGSEWSALKIVPARTPGDRRVCIVAEGETDGARLTILYPEADVAVLPAGADPRPHTAKYAAQLAGYELVLMGHDNDAAGDNGAALLSEAVTSPVQRWLPPENFNDWGSIGDDHEEYGFAPPLPDPPEVEIVGGLVFEDLRAVLAGDLRPPDTLVDDFLYTEGVHWLSGHPGEGKTTLAMNAAWLVMADPEHPRDVVWLDYEGGVRPTILRLKEVGVPEELMLERFHYAGWPQDAAQYFGDVAQRWPGALIIVDSASKALSLAGLDENSPSEVTAWVAPVVKSAKTHALPVLVIDHVTKDAGASSRYSRGAGSKLADADVAWFVEKVEDFNRETIGKICCHQKKDRAGSLPYAVWYEVGDGAGGLPVTPIEPPQSEQDPRPTEGTEDVAI